MESLPETPPPLQRTHSNSDTDLRRLEEKAIPAESLDDDVVSAPEPGGSANPIQVVGS